VVGCAIAALAAGGAAFALGKSHKPVSSASPINSSASPLSSCEYSLSNWVIFQLNNSGNSDDVTTFGIKAPFFMWIATETGVFNLQDQTAGQGSADQKLGADSLRECSLLSSEGWPIGAVPPPPASPTDPAPIFYGVQQSTTTTDPPTSTTSPLVTTTTVATTSCGAPPLPSHGANNATSAAIEAVRTFMKNPRNDAQPNKPLTITGAVDPCNSAWVQYGVYNPAIGSGFGYEHLVGSTWDVVVGPATVGNNGVGVVPARVLRDFGY
jgi:hypothetical protein